MTVVMFNLLSCFASYARDAPELVLSGIPLAVMLLIHFVRSAANVLELARDADVVVLAVKPQNVEEMLRTFKSRSAQNTADSSLLTPHVTDVRPDTLSSDLSSL